MATQKGITKDPIIAKIKTPKLNNPGSISKKR